MGALGGGFQNPREGQQGETSPLNIDSDEVAEYIKAVLKGVNDGLGAESISQGYFLGGTVKIRIGIRNVGEREGGLKLQVVGVGGKRSKEEDAVIEFEVVNLFSKKYKEIFEEVMKRFTTEYGPPKSSTNR